MYTTITGPWYGGKGRFVVDIEDLGSITSGTTGVWVRSNWYLEFTQSTWDASNTFDPGGSFNDAAFGPVNIGTSSNPVTRALIWEKDIWVNLLYGAETGIQVAGNITGINNVGTTIYVDQWFNIPARPYSKPNPATGLTSVWASDSQANLSWTPNYTSGSGATPWSYQYIDRTETNSWSAFTTISGQLGKSPTSWSDTSLQVNKRYDYRHAAKNPAGWSSYCYAAAPVYTTPAAPSAVSATKNTDNSITIVATNAAPWADAWEFSDSPDGTTWTVIGATNASATFVQSDPNQAVTHRYRVRARTPNGLWSAYSVTSNTVQLQAPPNPPTWGSLSVAYDTTSAIATPFTHNPVDTTSQTAYEMQSRVSADNGATWSAWELTGKIASTTSSRTWAANTWAQNRAVEVQVRTWGAHATASGWSPSASFRTSARPTVGLSSPAMSSVLSGKTLSAAWAYSDTEGTAQAAYRLTLYVAGADGAMLEQWSGSGSAASYSPDYALSDDTSYRLTVEVKDGHGLWSDPAGTQFSVNYLLPPAPIVTASWDEANGAAVLDIINPTPTGAEPAAVSNNIYRDGVLVATGIPTDTAWTDRLPLPAGSTYVVESVSSLPSAAPSTVPLAAVDSVLSRFWLNAGNEWEIVASFRGNVKRSQTQGRLRALDRYSGRELEVETLGEGRVSEFRVQGLLFLEEDSPFDFFSVANSETPVCYRDRYGSWFVSPSPVDSDADNDALAGISVSMSQVDFTDPVRGS